METMGCTVLTSQFVAGLLPELKSKVAGSEGGFELLLVKARFEEAKLRDLSPPPKKKTQPSQDATHEQESQPLAKSTPSGQTWCRKCRSHHHH